jgi:hypothetical protein
MAEVLGQDEQGNTVIRRDDGSTFTLPAGAIPGLVAPVTLPTTLQDPGLAVAAPTTPALQPVVPESNTPVLPPQPVALPPEVGPQATAQVAPDQLAPIDPYAEPDIADVPIPAFPEEADISRAEEGIRQGEQASLAEGQKAADAQLYADQTLGRIEAQKAADALTIEAEDQKLRGNIEKRRQAFVDKETKDQRALIDSVENFQYDMNRFWNSRSTPQKVAAFIGVAISGWLGDEDIVMEQMNRMMDKDLELQEAEVNKKKYLIGQRANLYAAGLDAFKDEEAARDFAKASMLKAAIFKGDSQMAGVTDKLATARWASTRGKLEAESVANDTNALARGEARAQQKWVNALNEGKAKQDRLDRQAARKAAGGKGGGPRIGAFGFPEDREALIANPSLQVTDAQGRVLATGDTTPLQFRNEADRKKMEEATDIANGLMDSLTIVQNRLGIRARLPSRLSAQAALIDTELKGALANVIASYTRLSDQDLDNIKGSIGFDVTQLLRIESTEERINRITEIKKRIQDHANRVIGNATPPELAPQGIRFGFKHKPSERVQVEQYRDQGNAEDTDTEGGRDSILNYINLGTPEQRFSGLQAISSSIKENTAWAYTVNLPKNLEEANKVIQESDVSPLLKAETTNLLDKLLPKINKLRANPEETFQQTKKQGSRERARRNQYW